MAIADRISAMYDHVGDIYDTLELGGDTTENKNIININTEIKREYKDFLAHGTDVLWNNWEKVSGSGETLTLNNTMEGKMKVDLKGNTQQNGTPTPSTPIPIQVVSGDNTIKVEGKNLLDTSNVTGSGWNIYGIPNTLKPNTKYTFSIQGTTSFSYGLFTTSGVGSTTTITRLANYQSAGNSVTFTTPADMSNELGLLLGGSATGAGNESIDVIKPQIELGETKTDYKPYQSATYPISLGNIELCKIGTYQDSIVKDNGKWYLNKQIGKVVLNGSNYPLYGDGGSSNDYWEYSRTGMTGGIGSQASVLTNYFNQTTNSRIVILSNGGLYFRFPKASGIDVSTNTLMNNWLSTHNTIVYYVLATPTYEEIADTTLLSQLEALAYSYEGTTNISQVNDDMASELDVVALQEM